MNQNQSEEIYDGELVMEDSQIIEGIEITEDTQTMEERQIEVEILKDTKETESFIEMSYDVVKEPKFKIPKLETILGFGKKKKIKPELKDNEPYLKLVEMCGMTKMPQCQGTSLAKTSVRNLMEKLRHESPFGHGENAVISCENEIARYLNELEENVQGLFDEEVAIEASEVVVINCKLIQAKLKVRAELKRK